MELCYLVLLETMCVNLQAKLLLSIHNVWTFINSVSIPDEASSAPLHTVSKLYDIPVGYVTPPSF